MAELLADMRPIIYEDVFEELGPEWTEQIFGLMGNEIFVKFVKMQKEKAWLEAVNLDPFKVKAEDYHATMCHLKRVTGMWDSLTEFVERAKARLLERAQKSPGNQ